MKLAAPETHSAVAGVALTPDGRTAFASLLFVSRVAALDLATGATRWTASLDAPGTTPVPRKDEGLTWSAGGLEDLRPLVDNADPLALVYDAGRRRVYASLWGRSEVAVLDAAGGRVLARWAVGLHPNELVLSPDGRRLFVANGGRNSVTVLDAESGRPEETLSSSFSPGDLPGSTPDSLALSRDGACLFVANADNNDVAVFDVSVAGKGRALGFIPTGWYPTSVRLTPGDGRLLVLSTQGLKAKPNNLGETTTFTNVGLLYRGALGVLDLPPARAPGIACGRSSAGEPAGRAGPGTGRWPSGRRRRPAAIRRRSRPRPPPTIRSPPCAGARRPSATSSTSSRRTGRTTRCWATCRRATAIPTSASFPRW